VGVQAPLKNWHGAAFLGVGVETEVQATKGPIGGIMWHARPMITSGSLSNETLASELFDETKEDL